MSLAAVAEGEQVYRSSILYWIDKLKASEMQGPYYFEALKSLLSSEYRECELKICSVADRKCRRLSVRKPHFSGAKGDVERLPGAPVASGYDHSKPRVEEYKDETLPQDTDSGKKGNKHYDLRTSFEKKRAKKDKISKKVIPSPLGFNYVFSAESADKPKKAKSEKKTSCVM